MKQCASERPAAWAAVVKLSDALCNERRNVTRGCSMKWAVAGLRSYPADAF